MRAGERVGIQLPDLDLQRGLVIIQRGKGGKGRVVPLGPQTGRTLDRYIRIRCSHRLADSPNLWLSDRGKGFGYYALYNTLTYRAELGGIPDFHPHVLSTPAPPAGSAPAEPKADSWPSPVGAHAT